MSFRQRRLGLRGKIIAWSFIPTVIILTAVALITFYAYQTVAEELVVGRNRDLTRLSAGQFAASLSTYANVLTALARTADITQNVSTQQTAALSAARDRLLIFDGGVLVLNASGRVVAAEPARPATLGQDWSDHSYFRLLVEGQTDVYSDIVSDGNGGAQAVAVAVPLLNGQGQFNGALIGLFRLGATTFSALYGDIVRLHIGASGHVLLVDGEGRLIYYTLVEHFGEDLRTQPAVEQVLKGQAGSLRTRDLEGRDVLATYAPVPGTNWGLISEESWAGLSTVSQGYSRLLLALLGLGVIVPAWVVWGGVQTITARVAQLIQAAQEIADGQFGRQIVMQTGDELEDLAQQFNRMSGSLAASYAELKTREERMALVLQATSDGIWDWDLRTDAVYFSPRWKSMLGFAEDEIDNTLEEWRRRVHPEEVGHAQAEVQAFLAGQSPHYQLEQRLRHKDGSYRWILARGLALRDAAGQPYRLVGAHTDLTERKLIESELQKREERYRLISMVASDYMFSTQLEADGRLVLNWVAGAFEKITGYTFEEYVSRGGWRAALHPDDVAQDDHDLEKLRSNQQVISEVRTIHQSGRIVWVRVYGHPVWDAQDQTLGGIYGAVQDITERKRNEEEILRLARLYAVLSQVNLALVHARSRAALFQQVCQAAVEYGGFKLAWVGWIDPQTQAVNAVAWAGEPQDYIHQLQVYADDRPAGQGPTGTAIREARPYLCNNLFADPSTMPWREAAAQAGLRASAAFPFWCSGKVRGALTLYAGELNFFAQKESELLAEVALDLSYGLDHLEEESLRQQAEAEVRTLNAELEQRIAARTAELSARTAEIQALNLELEAHAQMLEAANRELEAFSYSVSHDLKAPLRGIDGYSRLLQEDYAATLDEDGRFFIHNIRTATAQMGDLIDDLLAYSRLERRALNAASIDLPLFVNDLLAAYADDIQARPVAVRVTLPPITVRADFDGLAMALRNLVENALKFTQGVAAPAIVIGGEATERACLLWVQDNGIGFDMKYHDRIFEIFQRLQRAEDYPGTGVGLALVRKALQRMGGRVWAKSRPGEGATFYLEIPR